MHRALTRKLLPHLAIVLACSASVLASELDHKEFEATLHAPYGGDAAAGRTFTLDFDYPHVQQAQDVAWRIDLLGPTGEVLQSWLGAERLSGAPVTVKVHWAGRLSERAMVDGVYQVRMQALAQDATGKGKLSDAEVETRLAAGSDELIEQVWDIGVGQLQAPAMPAFTPLRAPSAGVVKTSSASATQANGLAAPAPASLPYTVYFGNLHSQTNHSDGGGALSTCVGAQNPQSAALGPADAYAYALGKGLDILMASEHNHMYDGSDSTNTAADPAVAKALYQTGLTAAANFNAAHPNFLAVYGLEWGVISNGGHLNIFNSPELLGWELNASGQLIADTLTAKNDYAGLYTLMRQRGWIGQFNHPASTGQFLVNAVPFGYTADGDAAMAMCEVLNTSAFSVNTTETETSRSTYEGACNKALEAGYHVAFTTDQDNHCANWGASYTNRTGVLIPNGTALSQASFIAALKARRVFATMDKGSQLVLTGNGHIMGERFTNSGSLQLVANFASASGKAVSTVKMYEGVPGRNGAVTLLSSTATTTITPSLGEHFYYAKLTQTDGNILWSAPIWVTQSNGSTQLVANGGFESGAASWTASAGVITSDATEAAHAGTWKAWLNGYGGAHTDTLYQQVAIPSAAASASLSFWLRIDSSETTTTSAYDTLKVQVRNSAGTALATLATYSNLNKGTSFVQRSFDLSAYKGQTVWIYFEGIEGSTLQTSFIIDDVSLTVQ